jgi:hypothetical protein
MDSEALDYQRIRDQGMVSDRAILSLSRVSYHY